LKKCAESIYELIDHAIKSTRRITTNLRPPLLDDLGLYATLEWQCAQFEKHHGIECRIICEKRKEKGCEECKTCEYKLGNAISISLFRLAQEALTNVARHSGATRVAVKYRPSKKSVFLSIGDNGCGIPEGHVIASTSYGMRGMRERIEQLGGEIKFAGTPGHGLRVTINLPLTAAS
jgi:signal transduction histidine kinase